MAWQLQPPKSISLKAQERQGSFIQSVPRKALKADPFSQMSSRVRSFTLSKTRLGIDYAAWQGRTLPAGVTLSERLPQPPTHGLG
jgi:hypothetical protein